jgi:hypothetical protein
LGKQFLMPFDPYRPIERMAGAAAQQSSALATTRPASTESQAMNNQLELIGRCALFACAHSAINTLRDRPPGLPYSWQKFR